jgi:hypothetical protein
MSCTIRGIVGINTSNKGRVIIFGGGIPLVEHGRIVGAVGASGGTVAQDIEIARAAVQAFEHLSGYGHSHMPHARNEILLKEDGMSF